MVCNTKLFAGGLPFRQHPAVGVVADLAPGQFIQRMTGEERGAHRGELDPHADGGAAFGKVARQEEFIVAEAAV